MADQSAVDALSERQWSLLLATYTDRQQLMVSNEDMGERRFQVLMTVVAAVGVALGLVSERFDTESLQWTALLMASLLTLLGYGTTMRMAKRDAVTTQLKRDLLRIREFVAHGNPGLIDVLPHMSEKTPRRPRALHPTSGLLDQVAIVTATFAGLAVGTVLGGRVPNPVTVVVTVAAAVVAWVLLIVLVRRVYRAQGVLQERSPSTSSSPGETFRAGVGIVVHDGHGQVLICERGGLPGSWQFPQGGIERGERARDAAVRELREETGLTEDMVTFERELGRWLTYEVPPEHRSPKTGKGQAQWWFLAGLRDDASLPALPAGEFVSSQWVSWDEALTRVVAFKRDVYAEVAAAFDTAPDAQRRAEDP